MDVVEGVVGPGPFKVQVIDFELEIGWNPGRLNGRDVSADDFGFRKLVGKVDGPNASASSNVDGLLDFLWKWGGIQLSGEDEGVQVMEDVHRFGMTRVIGLPCFSIANVAVISSSKNFTILKDALGEGSGAGEKGADGGGSIVRIIGGIFLLCLLPMRNRQNAQVACSFGSERGRDRDWRSPPAAAGREAGAGIASLALGLATMLAIWGGGKMTDRSSSRGRLGRATMIRQLDEETGYLLTDAVLLWPEGRFSHIQGFWDPLPRIEADSMYGTQAVAT